jgi:hypothetical protein
MTEVKIVFSKLRTLSASDRPEAYKISAKLVKGFSILRWILFWPKLISSRWEALVGHSRRIAVPHTPERNVLFANDSNVESFSCGVERHESSSFS